MRPLRHNNKLNPFDSFEKKKSFVCRWRRRPTQWLAHQSTDSSPALCVLDFNYSHAAQMHQFTFSTVCLDVHRNWTDRRTELESTEENVVRVRTFERSSFVIFKISVRYTVQWCALCGETKERETKRHIVHFKISKQSDWIDCEPFSLSLSLLDDVWGESAYVYEYVCLRIRWSPTKPMTTSHLLGNIALTSLSSITKLDKGDANAECDTLYYSRHIFTLHPCEMSHHAASAS